jgi:hypothetical protein
LWLFIYFVIINDVECGTRGRFHQGTGEMEPEPPISSYEPNQFDIFVARPLDAGESELKMKDER